MVCQRCGTNLENNDCFCSNCGNSMIDNLKMNDISFDEMFIKSYMGSKADRIYYSVKNGGVNIWALLFGVGYYIYRKMYFVSIIIIIIIGLIAKFIPNNGFPIWILIGGLFCPLYKWDITRKLRKIKRSNPNATESELIGIAKKLGGTSFVGVLFFGIVLIVSIILEVRK